MTDFLFYGKKGKLFPETIDSLEWLMGITHAPFIETDLDSLFKKKIIQIIGTDYVSIAESAIRQITPIYQAWERFGPDGDIISLTEIIPQTYLVALGRLTFPKPGLTADIVPIVRDVKGRRFLICIIRRDELGNPGRGKPALIGGFRNIQGDHFASGIETIVAESEEEAGLIFRPFDEFAWRTIQSTPNLPEVFSFVTIGDFKTSTYLKLLGTYLTSKDEEFRFKIDEKNWVTYKRVYETVAYACFVDFDRELTAESLAQMLKFGDDADGIVVFDVTNGKRPDLAFSHHNQIVNDALNNGNGRRK